MTGDIIALSPPLIIERAHIDELFGKLADVLQGRRLAARTACKRRTPGPLAGTGRSLSADAGLRRDGPQAFTPCDHGNVVETEKIARPSLLNTSSGVPSSVSMSLPSTYFSPRSKLPSA